MMCVLCQRPIYRTLSWAELLTWQKLYQGTCCSRCLAQFQRLPAEGVCRGCGCPDTAGYCSDCRMWQNMYPGLALSHRALYKYNPAMKDFFHRYKFKGDIRLAGCFIEQLRCYLSAYDYDILVPIPLADARLRERGFNQVSTLLDYAELPYANCLIKPVDTDSQSAKSRAERLRLKQPFALSADNYQLAGRRVLIMDDIYTTGRTMIFAYDLLLHQGVKSIQSVSIAR